MLVALIVLSIFVSLPCTTIVVARLFKNDGYTSTEAQTYVKTLSIGSLLNTSTIKKYSDLAFSEDAIFCQFLADLVVYFNIAGILYMMIHSIILRRNLVKMAFEIDSV